MYEKYSIPVQGFIQAFTLTAYIALVATFMTNIENVFQNASDMQAAIVVLTLFVLSATICGTIVLGRAGYLFWEKRYDESFQLLGWTIGWIVIFLVLILGSMWLNTTQSPQIPVEIPVEDYPGGL